MAYGTVNADVIGTSVAGSNLGAGNASIMKNRIINGAMVIDQRNAGASVTATNSAPYSVDRWFVYSNPSSKFTAQQNAGSVTPPTGFVNYLGMTSSSAYTVSGTDIMAICQRIEGNNLSDLGWGTASAKTVTLSFQVYSSLTGTFGGSLQNSDSTRSYPFTYTISSANTWTTISVTIAGDTSGTWAATNTTGMQLWIGIGVGATRSGTANTWAGANYVAPTGAVSVVGTSGATFYITGVQLEVGSSATGFDYRVYGTELMNCQRYFQVAGDSNNRIPAFCANGDHVFSQNLLLCPMRAQPTISATGILAFDEYYVSGRTQSSIDAARNSGGTNFVIGTFGNFSGLTRGNPGGLYGSTTGVVYISAEL